MDGLFIAFALAVFVTVALLTLGGAMLWNATRGARALRIAQRLRTLSQASVAQQASAIALKKPTLGDLPTLAGTALASALIKRLETLVQQAGLQLSLHRLGLQCLGMAGLGLLACMLLRLPLALWPLGLCPGSLPVLWLTFRRRQRLARIEAQLPDVLDLLSRALRAGHAFPAALRMAGEEMADPIGRELRLTSDEVNYGIALSDALNNLAARVPGTDVGHFVVAVLIQRETGGNLAELLSSIATLVRERIKLHGQVRVLSAEGRFSAWILGALPFLVAGVLQLTNPDFISVLWSDPAGQTLLGATVAVMMFGVLWMRRMVRIRV